MLVAGSYDGKGEGMTEQDIMEVISEVNQRVANVEKERTAEQVTFRLAIKRLTRLIGQLGEDHAAEAELIQFAADSKDIDILKERLVQINSFGLRNIEEPRLFIDMDGTLAKFQTVDTLEKLYEKGYFYNLPPNENVVEAIRNIINNHPEKEVYILSAVLSDSKYAKAEKMHGLINICRRLMRSIVSIHLVGIVSWHMFLVESGQQIFFWMITHIILYSGSHQQKESSF